MASEEDSGCPRGCLTTGTDADTKQSVTVEDIVQAAIVLHEVAGPPPRPRGMTHCIIHLDELPFYPYPSEDLNKPLSDDALFIPHSSKGVGDVDLDC